MTVPPAAAELARANQELRAQLEEAQDIIQAIRTGAVDALAVQGPGGPRIFTLEGADQGYRTLIEQMNEGALLLSAEATVLYCNACLAELLGCPLGEVMGRRFDEFVPAAGAGHWAGLVRAGWAGKSKGELLLQTTAGALVPFSVAMNALPFGGTTALAVIVTDLSAQREVAAVRARVAAQTAEIERQTAELARQEAARRQVEQAAADTRRILEGIPQIAWTANARGENTYLNRRWFDYTGQDPAAPPAEPWEAFQHPDDAADTYRRWQRSLASGEPFEAEFRLRNRAGGYRWMLTQALPAQHDTRGRALQWVGTCTDIHEHRQALARVAHTQRQLEANNEQLTRANVDLDTFVYTASHDLRAPITNIEGLVQALREDLQAVPAAAPVQPLLDMVQDAVDRFRRTLDHLTTIAKLQSEAGPVAAVDVAALVEEVRLDLLPQLRASGARLHVDVAACPTLSFSARHLRSICFNLLSNALKYRHPDRVPEVRLSCRPAGKGQVALAVQDNGLGIRANRLGDVFVLFQRLHVHVEGSGIGLFMVKKIVENAGGRVEVVSEEGVGSTFTVLLRVPPATLAV